MLSRSFIIIAASLAVTACSDDGSNVRSTPLPIHENTGGTPTGNAPEWPPGNFDAAGADTVVKVKIVEYSYEVTPPQAKGRKVFFEVTNAGLENHEFEVVLAEERVVSVPTIAPGETKTLAVDFPRGVYTLQCVVLKGVQTHSMLGEKTSFTVTSLMALLMKVLCWEELNGLRSCVSWG